MSTLVVLQPNYLPWRGVFDLIDRADVFVFLDDVQYTKNDWRNRNRVRQPDGRPTWLTVPVSSSTAKQIRDVTIDYSRDWRKKQLRTLMQCYGGTPWFPKVEAMLQSAFSGKPERLVELTIPLTMEIARRLGSSTSFLLASALGISGDRNARLVAMAQAVGASTYLSGPAARSYIDFATWEAAAINLEFIAYPDYPAYRKDATNRDMEFSIIDLLCEKGDESATYIWGDRTGAAWGEGT